MRISSPVVNLYRQSSTKAETVSQALYGESIRIISDNSPWLEIELQQDSYTGFVQSNQVTDKPHNPNHRVTSKATPLFLQADIKSPVAMLLPLGSELTLHDGGDENFWQTDTDHFVWKAHTTKIDNTMDEPLLSIAQRFFTGAPYLWGGRSTNGLDCSALVQLSAMLRGYHLPRDTKDQEAYFQSLLSANSTPSKPQLMSKPHLMLNVQLIDYDNRQENDLMYWPGHVAIMVDRDTVFHATAHSLDCRQETLANVEARAGVAHALWRF